MSEYIIADGGVGEWVIPLITILGFVILVSAWVKRKEKGSKVSAIVGLGLIVLTLFFYIQPQTRIILDEEGIWVRNPWFTQSDIRIYYPLISWYGYGDRRHLGHRRTVSRTNGYSDGTVRQGWFRVKDGREAYVYTTGNQVLAIETDDNILFIFAPDNFHLFLHDFENRYKNMLNSSSQ